MAKKRISFGLNRSKAFPARYPGQCSKCDQPVEVGQLIAFRSDNKIEHIWHHHKNAPRTQEELEERESRNSREEQRAIRAKGADE